MSIIGPGLKKCGNMCMAMLISYINETGKRKHCMFVPNYHAASDKLMTVHSISLSNTGVKGLNFECEVGKVFLNVGDTLHKLQDTWANVTLKCELSPDSF